MIRTRRAALAQSGYRFSEKIMLKQKSSPQHSESFVRGVFVDANESLAVIFERLEKPGDPKGRIHRDPDITPEQYPALLDAAQIAILDHTPLLTQIAKKSTGR